LGGEIITNQPMPFAVASSKFGVAMATSGHPSEPPLLKYIIMTLLISKLICTQINIQISQIGLKIVVTHDSKC
jgi:hypothetical protein